MNRSDIGVRSILSSILYIMSICSQVAGFVGCRYFYTEQPPLQLNCNPYSTGELNLRCTIRDCNGENITIAWYWRPPLHPKYINKDQFVSHTITPISGSSDEVMISSMLELKRINGSHVGTYWCQPIINSTHILTSSSSFYLLTPSAYDRRLEKEECKKGVYHRRITTECAAFLVLSPSEVDITPMFPSPGTPRSINTGQSSSQLVTANVHSSSSNTNGLVSNTIGVDPTPSVATSPADPCSEVSLILILSIALFALIVVIVFLLIIGVVIWMR